MDSGTGIGVAIRRNRVFTGRVATGVRSETLIAMEPSSLAERWRCRGRRPAATAPAGTVHLLDFCGIFVGLSHDIEADRFAKGRDEFLGQPAGLSLTHRQSVDAGAGHDGKGGGGVESLVGIDDFVGPEVFLGPGHRHCGQQVQDGVPRHAHQNIVALGGEHPPLAHDEKVGAAPFGDEAAIVRQQREGVGIHPVGLQVGHLVVDPASVLDLGLDQVSRHRSLGDDHRVDTRAVQGAVAGPGATTGASS